MRPGAKTQRGQTLVLFVLCLLLLTLLVTMTLSFGTMAKEKMELEQVADQAAYSQAVATARTFNELAVYNRAQLAQMVSLLGVESALSFAAAWKAYVSAMLLAYIDVEAQLKVDCDAYKRALLPGNNGTNCACEAFDDVRDRRKKLYDANTPNTPCTSCSVTSLVCGEKSGEYERITRKWQDLDIAAGNQVRAIQGSAFELYNAQTDALTRVLVGNTLLNSKLAQALVAKAAAGRAEWSAVSEEVSLREVNAVIVTDGDNLHAVRAAMGSRGHPFVTRRLTGAETLTKQMNTIVGVTGAPITEPNYAGSSYFGKIGPMAHSNTVGTSSSAYAWGDDHFVNGIVTYCSRSAKFAFDAVVKSTDLDETTDNHVWHPNFGGGVCDERDPPSDRHTTARCRIYLPTGGWIPCVSVWAKFFDYQPLKVADGNDVFGQPKTFAALKRDYSTRTVADPWNLAFRFRLSSASNGAVFALRGLKTNPQSGSNQIILADGTDISQQSAVSTGIAYYHRRKHWKEPPNFFNPFWRAGLVHADVDATGEGDFISQINKTAPWAAEAFSDLRAQGYQGIP